MRNVNDDLLLQRIRDLEALFRANPLRSASVERGRVRMYGSSQLLIEGLLSLVGTLIGSGNLDWTGPWELAGNGAISGDVDVTGDVEVLGGGRIRVGNVIITPGAGGKITVGVGAAQIVIDGATGKITVGSMEITPTVDGGAVTFSNGSKLSANASSVGLTKGGSTVRIGDDTAGLLAGSTALTVSAAGVQISPSAIPTESTSGLPQGTLSITNTGFLRRAA